MVSLSADSVKESEKTVSVGGDYLTKVSVLGGWSK